MSTDSFTTPWGATIKADYREDTNDWNTLTSCLTEDEYQVQQLPKDGTAIDVGAHIGAVTMALASKGWRVIAAEILPENLGLLKINLEINKFNSDTASIVAKAVTDKDGEEIPAYYVDTSSETGNAHRFIGSTNARSGGDPHLFNGREVIVPTTTLEQIFKDFNLKKVDFLKVDIEGGEWDMISGTPKYILDKIARIAVEIESLDGKPTSTEEYGKLLGPDWKDISEQMFPLWCNPGNIVHGYFVNKKLVIAK